MRLLALLALCACAERSVPRPEVEIRQFQRGGYASAAELATTSAQSVWLDAQADAPVQVRVTAPTASGTYPLVLYLPGLGESTDAGSLWCGKWAAAGYVVIAMQPEADGRSVWRTPDARYGEFRNVAQAHFAPDALRRRMRETRFVLAEAARRARAGDTLLARADLARVAIAGFDLGAQTALAMGVASDAMLRGVVALSPYDTLERPAPEEDWSRVGLPALVVTGAEDVDPYGLIVQAALRQSVFERLPAGSKYELLLHAGRHDTLAGDVPRPPSATTAGRRRSARSSDGEGRSGARRGGRGGQSRAGGRDGEAHDGDAQPGTTQTPSPPALADSRELGSRMALREMAAVQSVSQAFLDSVLKDDALAREWLGRDAARYLRDLGMLRSK